MDRDNTSIWFITFVYGYPHHHMQRQLLDQIENITDMDSKQWIVIGDLNEFPSPGEKNLLVMAIPPGLITLTISLIIIIL